MKTVNLFMVSAFLVTSVACRPLCSIKTSNSIAERTWFGDASFKSGTSTWVRTSNYSSGSIFIGDIDTSRLSECKECVGISNQFDTIYSKELIRSLSSNIKKLTVVDKKDTSEYVADIKIVSVNEKRSILKYMSIFPTGESVYEVWFKITDRKKNTVVFASRMLTAIGGAPGIEPYARLIAKNIDDSGRNGD